MSRRCLSSFVVAAFVVSAFFGKAFGADDVVPPPVPDVYDIGVATVDITPRHPVRLTGYGNRKTEFESVEQRLFAKALVIHPRDDTQHPSVLITVDSLGVTDAITKAVAARLAKSHKLLRENVVISASHTHSAPALSGAATLLFQTPLTAEEKQHIDDYTAELTKHLGNVAEAALGAKRPATIRHGVGTVKFAVNRRVLKDGKWTGFGVVPTGAVDHAMPVLYVNDLPDPSDPNKADAANFGKLRAVLINYACHCTTLGGGFNKIHGDWAGCAQEQIEREHPGCTAMISIGCGADANPNPRTDDLAIVRQHGNEIAKEVKRLLAAPTALRPLKSGIETKFIELSLPLAEPPTKEEFERRTTLKGPIAPHAKLQLERLDSGLDLPTAVPYSVQTWIFGDTLAMVFLPGEVVVDYQKRLKRELDGRRLWINAYSNASPCYIASKRMLAEGGYEVDTSMYYYDKPQHFAPEVEDKLIAAVHRGIPLEKFHSATRFKADIEKILAREKTTPPPADGVLFIGSSTIVRWNLDRWFPNQPVISHGFGGSQLAETVFYFDKLVKPLQPKQIVVFAGSNDLALGKSPEEVTRDLVNLVGLVRRHLPQTKLYYLAITPSVARWKQIDTQRETTKLMTAELAKLNQVGDVPAVELIQTEAALLGPDGQPQPKLYVADGLHLSDEGYAIITKLVGDALKR